MRKDLYGEMFKLEETYWWHVAKRKLVRSLLGEYGGNCKNKILVDVGCGTGKFLEEMKSWKKWKEVVGLDGANEAIRFTKSRGIKRVKKADFETKLPLDTQSVDVITSLDVVEHINNDRQLVKEFCRILKAKGLAIITVPAYQWLWTYWDDMLGHKRRHTKESVERLFVEAGFEIEKISFFYSYLLPLAVAFRLLKSILPGMKMASDFVTVPSIVNKCLLALAEVETFWLRRSGLPTGLSVVCVARKRHEK